eukprot:830438-Prorocentrum_minimum.AAC.8
MRVQTYRRIRHDTCTTHEGYAKCRAVDVYDTLWTQLLSDVPLFMVMLIILVRVPASRCHTTTTTPTFDSPTPSTSPRAGPRPARAPFKMARAGCIWTVRFTPSDAGFALKLGTRVIKPDHP